MALEPTKLKIGHKVRYKGKDLMGRIIDIHEGPTGQFLSVNFGDKVTPNIKKLRPSQVVKQV